MQSGHAYEEFENKIKTKYMGRPMRFFECIGSTNVEAKAEAESGAAHGTLIVADKQTAGRGRRGRAWESPAGGNLYFSLILKPDFAPDKASMLTIVMAMAVWRSVEKVLQHKFQGNAGMEQKHRIIDEVVDRSIQMSVNCIEKACGINGIKWPNDIVIAGKKICGILTEMSLTGNEIAHVIIGVGINVSSRKFAQELVDKANSMEDACGYRISREALLVDIMQEFERLYELFCESLDLSAMQADYNKALVNCHREVSVLDPKGEFTGIARGINDVGELLVELSEGNVTEVYAGEVSVRGIYGYV